MLKYIFLLFSILTGLLAYLLFDWHWGNPSLIWSMLISMSALFFGVTSAAFLIVQIVIWIGYLFVDDID